MREYKSVVFQLIFVSLWVVGCCPCCNEEKDDGIIKENRDTNVNNEGKNNLNFEEEEIQLKEIKEEKKQEEKKIIAIMELKIMKRKKKKIRQKREKEKKRKKIG